MTEDAKKEEISWLNLNTWRQKLHELVDIETGSDKQQTVHNILKNYKVKGANAWMLMCSIMIASLGLDLNSPAVIIGAMLISPLMSPILGVGLGIGTNDRTTLRTSFEHFLISVLIALTTSFLYFKLTPYGGIVTAEIEGRTEPTFLDVLVAFFGGIAGIISGSRKDTSNAIPGVAIATALMPPLCVTGFGLANLGNPNVPDASTIMLNSFYLFFLNSALIALATFIIVRALRFPYVTFMNKKERRRTSAMITSFCVLLIIPSFFIFQNVLRDLRERDNIDRYIDHVFGDRRQLIDDFEVFRSESDTIKDKLLIKVYSSLDRFEKGTYYTDQLKDFNLNNMEVDIIPSSNVDLNKLKQMETQIADVGSIIDNQIKSAQQVEKVKDSIIARLESEVMTMGGSKDVSEQVFNEMKTLFPDVEQIGFARANLKSYDSDSITQKPIVLISWEDGKSRSSKSADRRKMLAFLETRLPAISGLTISECEE